MQPDLHTSLCVENPNYQVLAGRNKRYYGRRSVFVMITE